MMFWVCFLMVIGLNIRELLEWRQQYLQNKLKLLKQDIRVLLMNSDTMLREMDERIVRMEKHNDLFEKTEDAFQRAVHATSIEADYEEHQALKRDHRIIIEKCNALLAQAEKIREKLDARSL